MIHSIFFDIDGTLVSFKTHTIPPSAIEAVNACRAHGIRIFLCTGRPRVLVQDFSLPEYGGLLFDGLIAQNGGYCEDNQGRVIYQSVIDPRDIQSMLRYLREQETLPVSMVTKDKVYINYVDDHVRDLADLLGMNIPQIHPLEEVTDPVLQMNIYAGSAKVADIMDKVFRYSESSRWHPHFADITPKGDTKKTGIEKMLAHYRLDRKGTMAFGDGGNDIPMLEYVEVGVAMGNADDPEVFAAATHVAPPLDEDGVAHFLSSYFRFIGS
ncbi:MAG: HAD family hydrolase [Bacteroidales bacterium]|jgi:Cof subfamily protein (haloacid dehalogenase superfamily)